MSSRIVDPRREAEEAGEESRSDGRRAERVKEEALARLVSELCELSSKRLEQLALDEELVGAIEGARAIRSAPARNRQLRLVRTLLRDADWVALRRRMAVLRETGAAPEAGGAGDAASDASWGWALRLLGEGAPALEAFLAEFPRADRGHLRQLVRAVHRASAERRTKAERQLTAALRGFLR
jgi:ribosome-associated protein